MIIHKVNSIRIGLNLFLFIQAKIPLISWNRQPMNLQTMQTMRKWEVRFSTSMNAFCIAIVDIMQVTHRTSVLH